MLIMQIQRLFMNVTFFSYIVNQALVEGVHNIDCSLFMPTKRLDTI